MVTAGVRRRRYAAAHNKDLEQEGAKNPLWGVWDKTLEQWAEPVVSEWYYEAQMAANRWEYGENDEGLHEEDEEDRWQVVETWLTTHYSSDYLTPDLLACIRSQDDWRYIDVRADRFAGAQAGEDDHDFDRGIDFAISALVECHDGPHLETCPDHRA